MYQNWVKVEDHLNSNDNPNQVRVKKISSDHIEEIVLPQNEGFKFGGTKVANLNSDIAKKVKKSVKKEAIKTIFQEWLHITSIDPFAKIFENHNPLAKLIWTCILIVLTSLTGYLLIQNLILYYQYDVVTQVNVISVRPMNFPTITICNLNTFTTRYAQSLIANVSIKNYGRDLTNINVTYDQAMLYLPNITELTKMYVAQSNFTQDELINLFGDSVDKFLSAKFSGQNLSLNNFNHYYSYDLGVCLQFNSGKLNTSIRQSFREGKEFGLTFIYPFMQSSNLYPISISDGFVIFIHESSFEPIIADGFILNPYYTETNIAMTKSITVHYESPYSECRDLTSFSSDLHDFIVYSLNKTYRQYDCFNLCRQKLYIKNCGCYYPKYPRLYNSTSCLNQSQWECISDPKNDLDSSNQKECTLLCPLECESITYGVQLSSAWYPTQQLGNFWLNKTCQVNDIKDENCDWSEYYTYGSTYPNSSLAFNLFFPYLEYTEITETPKTSWFDLTSQVGGSLGIFLGLTVFHFLEIIEIFFLILFNFLK